MVYSIDPVIRMRDLLIHAGTTGMKQRDILRRMQATMSADEVTEQLEQWLKLDYVQRFEMPPGPKGGRPATVWRATTLIMES